MSGDVDTRRSTLGFLIDCASVVVSLQIRLQKYVALSTVKVELFSC